MSNKRRKLADLEDIPTVRAYLPDEAIADLPPPGSAAAARLVGQLADLLGVPDHEIEEARVSYPSFSGAKWQCVGGRYNLPRRFPHGAAFASLEQVFEAAWKAADVYGDARFQTQEAARLRVLDPVRVRHFLISHDASRRSAVHRRNRLAFPWPHRRLSGERHAGDCRRVWRRGSARGALTLSSWAARSLRGDPARRPFQMVSVAGSLFFVIGVNQLTMNNAKYHAQLFSELLCMFLALHETHCSSWVRHSRSKTKCGRWPRAKYARSWPSAGSFGFSLLLV
jgi:hypothetical protein